MFRLFEFISFFHVRPAVVRINTRGRTPPRLDLRPHALSIAHTRKKYHKVYTQCVQGCPLAIDARTFIYR